jgi:glycosyltransferase involved in cell wall biosynthesis
MGVFPLQRQPLTVLVPCFNNQDIIARCLDSVVWADEILICDSFSTDRTLEIARRYTDRIIQHEYINSAKQKNWAIPQATHEWVLLVDTDEVISPELRREIERFLAAPPANVSACQIARRNMILGQWVRDLNLWPDYAMRLFRRDLARYQKKEVHADMVAPGCTHTFQEPLTHYGTPSWSKQIGYLDRYTRYQADEYYFKLGRRFTWWRALTRPPGAFLYYYFYRRGYRYGFRGFFLAAHFAIYSFYTYAKLWEIDELKLERSPR